MAYDKYKTYFAEGSNYIRETDLDEILEKADIVSLHLPLNDETHHFFNKKLIEQFKKEIILINTSRGKVVNTGDIIEGLKTKKLKGACMDVFENEKTNTFDDKEHKMYDELYDFENVILTPHVAGWTVESKARLAQIILDKILTSI